MKKIIFPLLFAATLVSFNSCEKKPYDKTLDMLETYTSKIEKASTSEELNELMLKAQNEAEEYEKSHPEYKDELDKALEDETKKSKLLEAQEKFSKAVSEKKQELSKGDSDSDD